VDIFGADISSSSLADVARHIATHEQVKRTWITANSGFSNFYNAYRNTSAAWVKQHRSRIEHLVRAARKLKTDEEAQALAGRIEKMPGIPKANHDQPTLPANALLTPLLFALDPRTRFPVINGRKPIRQFIKARGLQDSPLSMQHHALVSLIGQNDWKDAADVDAAMSNAADVVVVTRPGQPATLVQCSKPLQHQPTSGKTLSVKDDADQTAIAKSSRNIVKRRLHNRMTNRFHELFGTQHDCKEGASKLALYDIMVMDCLKGKQGSESLLIEVKSSSEEPHVRMAIGQLFAYAYRLGLDAYKSAVLLPAEPATHLQELLHHLDIGCIWYCDPNLVTLTTSTPWLKKWVASQGVLPRYHGRF